MDLKSTQYIEKTGGVAKAFLFLFLLFLSSTYNPFKFASLENEETEVLGTVLPSKTSGDAKYIEGDDLSANCKFLIDRTTHWLG
ncbi:hypothetical protein [Parabacteroides sp.]